MLKLQLQALFSVCITSSVAAWEYRRFAWSFYEIERVAFMLAVHLYVLLGALTCSCVPVKEAGICPAGSSLPASFFMLIFKKSSKAGAR
jgi:hypothetical protein